MIRVDRIGRGRILKASDQWQMQEIDSNSRPPSIEGLAEAFKQISASSSELEYYLALATLARDLEVKHGIDRNTFETLFTVYQQETALPPFARKAVSHIKRLPIAREALKNLTLLAIISSAINFGLSQRDARIQFIQEQWKIAESGPRIGTARKDAIEFLASRNHNLSGLKAESIVLAHLRLPEKARLQKAVFSGSNLYQASIISANLAYSNFSSPDTARKTADYTNLHDANLSSSDLREANFSGTFMKNTCLRDAYLDKARFDRAVLSGTDFRGARGLSAEQFRNSINTKEALFDARLAKTLGAKDASKSKLPSSCGIKPMRRPLFP